jgi:hypothetical protein
VHKGGQNRYCRMLLVPAMGSPHCTPRCNQVWRRGRPAKPLNEMASYLLELPRGLPETISSGHWVMPLEQSPGRRRGHGLVELDTAVAEPRAAVLSFAAELLMSITSLSLCSPELGRWCLAGSVLQHRPSCVSGVPRSGQLLGIPDRHSSLMK